MLMTSFIIELKRQEIQAIIVLIKTEWLSMLEMQGFRTEVLTTFPKRFYLMTGVR